MSSATIDYRDRPLGHGSWTREELIARLWLDKKQVSMIADFDLFIMGPCHRDATIDFFERASFMRRPVANGSTIMVFASCCGAYDEHFQRQLQYRWSEMTIRVPLTIRDYCGRPERDQVLEDLMVAKVMGL